MLTLAIEASNPNVPTPGVVVARDGLVLAERPLKKDGRHDDLLVPAIATVLEAAGVQPGDLDEVLVSIGPGGFTATRLACVAAAMLAELTGARLLAAPTVLVAAKVAVLDGHTGRPLVLVMATKGQQAYVARYLPEAGSFVEAGRSMAADAFDALLDDGDLVLHEGHLPNEFSGVLERRAVEAAPIRLSAEGLLACRDAARAVSPEALRPIYPREPDAVTQWRRRHGWAPGDA